MALQWALHKPQWRGKFRYVGSAARLYRFSPCSARLWRLMWNDDLAADRGSSCQQLSQCALMTGHPLLGMRVLDCMAAVDFLQSLPEVNAQMIVCTGQSGGSTAKLFRTALETRFAVSIPSCYFCTFEHSLMAMSHWDCNYAPGLLNLCTMYDIAGLAAPRPILIVAGEQDKIFPIEGVRIAYKKLQAICRALALKIHESFMWAQKAIAIIKRVWGIL